MKKRSVQVVHEHSELRSNTAAATQLAYLIQSSTCRTLLDPVKSCVQEHTEPIGHNSFIQTQKRPPKRPFSTQIIRRLHRVVHVELYWVSSVFYTVNFFHLQLDVSFDHVFGEHATSSQEVFISFEAFQSFTQ